MSTQPDFVIRNIYQQLTESALTYKLLAEKADDQALKGVFQDMSALREPMGSMLAHEVEKDGQQMPLPGTIGGIVDRIWLRIRDSIAHPDAQVVVDGCEQAEVRLLEHYDEALANEEVPMHVKRVLAQQRAVIASNIRTLHRAGV